MAIPYQGATFYKCALQVNPNSYAQFQGKAPFDDEALYNQAIADACIKNTIKVVGLADHGAIETSESLENPQDSRIFFAIFPLV